MGMLEYTLVQYTPKNYWKRNTKRNPGSIIGSPSTWKNLHDCNIRPTYLNPLQWISFNDWDILYFQSKTLGGLFRCWSQSFVQTWSGLECIGKPWKKQVMKLDFSDPEEMPPLKETNKLEVCCEFSASWSIASFYMAYLLEFLQCQYEYCCIWDSMLQ